MSQTGQDKQLLSFLNPHIAPLAYKITHLKQSPQYVSMSVWRNGGSSRDSLHFRTASNDPDEILADLMRRVRANIKQNAR
jgi:hypothetical protein